MKVALHNQIFSAKSRNFLQFFCVIGNGGHPVFREGLYNNGSVSCSFRHFVQLSAFKNYVLIGCATHAIAAAEQMAHGN